MDIVQVLEEKFQGCREGYGCTDEDPKVFFAAYENGEVEYASLFCCCCHTREFYNNPDAYKTMGKNFIARCLNRIKSWIS